MKRLLLITLALWIGACTLQPDRPSARPAAVAVASAHPQATEAGLAILAQGGNAFDAAVAVSATLAVVEPYSSGIGGGGFWLLDPADGAAVVVDGRETAPGTAHRDMYLDGNGNVIPGLSMDGPLAAGIPGEPAALVHIAEKYGRLPLAVSLAPAIAAARDGFPVTPHYQRMAGWRLEALRASPEAAATFLLDGEVPPLGHLIRQPALAATLEAIAESGRDGFYTGPLAAAMVGAVRQHGGIWSLDDLAGYRIIEREPIAFYSDAFNATVTTVPPPSSGGVALATLFNILGDTHWTEQDEATREHLLIEAMRRAYRDRAHFLGDSDFVEVPVARLTSPQHAAELAAGIDLEAATPSSALPGYGAPAGGNDTTHFAILDRDGNAVSATLSINYPFGAGFIAGSSGVLLNDEMDDFSAKPGVPNAYGLVGAEANAIAPGKRMLSSMSPTIIEDGRGTLLIGTPGGSRIITMVLLGSLEYLEGGDAEAVVSHPRIHHQYLPDTVFLEPGALDTATREALQLMGHTLREADSSWGNMQAITWEWASGVVEAASDPRVEGSAMVRPLPPQP